jgi:outer membrane protein TolC
MNSVYKSIFLLVFLMSSGIFAQAQSTIEQMDMIDFKRLTLPPLETLYENAKNSPSVEMYEAKIETEKSKVLTEKRNWLKYFKAGGSWQYGNIAINSSFTNENTPLFFQSSGQSQSSYYGTVGVSVPFDDILDRKNKVKRQQTEQRFAELEKGKWLDEQRIRIVNSYVKAKTALAMLKKNVEDHNVALTNYRMIENEFKSGNANITDLNAAKKLETEAYGLLKTSEADIVSEILTLEILSRTKIISP